MDYNNLNGFSLKEVNRVNIILGKNGCGKSYLLKEVEKAFRALPNIGQVRYVSPERAGFLQYEPSIDQNISSNPNWLTEIRRRNQSGNFKQQSMILYRRLELMVLRGIEQDHVKPDYQPRNFNNTIDKINTLLDRVRIERIENGGFNIVDKESETITSAEEISSGESELISLAIEFLDFVHGSDPAKENILRIDEPDVHLHPDLQCRLANFIKDELSLPYIKIILATHSTSLLSALARETDTSVAFMKYKDKNISFCKVTESLKQILPMFGAHPLSNVFNGAPILLLEGEDDERVWQQTIRSSEGRIQVYPCASDSITQLNKYEIEANNILESVYDNAQGYSLRDSDNAQDKDISDIGKVVRMRLNCRAAENMMLSDDVLEIAGINWATLQSLIDSFMLESPSHKYFTQVKAFVDGGYDRKGADLKDIRNVLVGLMTNKPWEVLVGQAIAQVNKKIDFKNPDSLSSYLGKKVINKIPGLSSIL